MVCRSPRDKAMSHTLHEAALRTHEFLGLRKNDVAFDKYGAIVYVRPSSDVSGVRTLAPEASLESGRKAGEYYLFDLKGPEDVPGLISDLAGRGAKIREVREMQNPLEELFR